MHHLVFKDELNAGQQEDHQEQEDCLHAGRLEPPVDDRVFIDVIDQRFCAVHRAAARQQLDLRKGLERIGNIHEHHKEYLRGRHRQNDVPDSSERPGTIQPRTLQQILRHIAETHQKENKARADVHPDRHGANAPDCRGLLQQPSAFHAKEVIEQAVFLPVDEKEDGRGG